MSKYKRILYYKLRGERYLDRPNGTLLLWTKKDNLLHERYAVVVKKSTVINVLRVVLMLGILTVWWFKGFPVYRSKLIKSASIAYPVEVYTRSANTFYLGAACSLDMFTVVGSSNELHFNAESQPIEESKLISTQSRYSSIITCVSCNELLVGTNLFNVQFLDQNGVLIKDDVIAVIREASSE